MGVAAHLGIRPRDYDVRIRTFIPRYVEMLTAASAALEVIEPRPKVVLDLGIGSGALAARVLATLPTALVIGIDSDEAMLAIAHRRLGRRVTTIGGDYLTTPFPRCDAISASFALHHVRSRRRKAALYARCFAALRRGGAMVNADCCLASNSVLQASDHAAWRAHLRRTYSAARSDGLLKTWAKEDAYFRLEDEVALMRDAGFQVDIPWRRDGFAVVVGVK